jgi:hypothetical protein
MAQKPRKNGKNDEEANETGSFELLSTSEFRHEIEHQMTRRIDDQLSAKFQASDP